MVPLESLIAKTHVFLDEFLAPLLSEVDKPRRRFLPQSLRGILFSGSLVVMEMCHWIRDGCTDSFHRAKRLLNHLVSPEGDLVGAVHAYRRQMAQHIQADTPLLIDLTDIAKPRARRLPYQALVRDGSTGMLVTGYWCIEVYAQLAHKRLAPLALDVYSLQDPAVGSENLQIERVIRAVDQDLQGRGVWIADRGFDRRELYETWFSLHRHFVVRQRGDRCIVTPAGVRIVLRDYVERLREQWAYAGHNTAVVYSPVRLPDADPPLWVVAHWRRGQERPLMLLTTLMVATAQQASHILWYYRQRWRSEEGAAFLKGRVGLERFRIRRYEAMQRLAILAMFAMGFLTWIQLRSKMMVRHLFSLTSRFRRRVTFQYYRLLDGLQELVRRYPFYLAPQRLPPRQNG